MTHLSHVTSGDVRSYLKDMALSGSRPNRRKFVVVPPDSAQSDQFREEDNEFDLVFPTWVQAHSRVFWTPVQVARRAAQLLSLNGKSRVLDVGSGVGKFCLAAQKFSPGNFFGVEHDPRLVDVARDAGEKMNAARAVFVCASVFDVDWKTFDALYFFNPFDGGPADLREPSSGIDAARSLGPSVRKTRERLDELRTGAKVVLYHGYGGDLPERFESVSAEWCGSGVLELWRKLP
jgi:SAM-dependent methyltransferase